MLKFAAALLAALSASAVAGAADLPNGYASPSLMRGEAAYNWSGIYGGASAGWASDKITAELASAVFGASRSTGFLGGVQVGFNKQSGGLVVGLEADVSLSNARGDNFRTVSGSYGKYAIVGSGNLESGLANLSTVRARVGYAFDHVLVYGTVGYAFARHKLSMTGALTATSGAVVQTPTTLSSSSNTMSGLALGAGVEYAFARGVSLKAEYIYVQFAKSNFFGDSWAGTDAKASLNLFRTGVNFRI